MALASSIYFQECRHPRTKQKQPSRKNKGRCVLCSQWSKRRKRPLKGGSLLTYIVCSNQKCSRRGVEQELFRTAPKKRPEVRSKDSKESCDGHTAVVDFHNDVKGLARIVFETWSLGVQKYGKERDTSERDIGIPDELKDDTQPIPKHNIAYGVCRWVQENPDTWVKKWKKVLKTLTFSYFLQNGYDGFLPDINWLFRANRYGSGLERILANKYNRKKPYPRRFSADEGE